MWILVGWVLVLLLLAAWSSFVWAVESMLAALLAKAGTLGSVDWTLPEGLTAWLPRWAAEWLVGTLENLTPQLQSLASALPSWLSDGLSVLAWGVWAVGAVVLLVIGVAIHVAIALVRKASQPAAQPAA